MRHLGALFLLVGCSASSVVNGINPVVGCTSDSDCEVGYSCQGGGCQFTQRTCNPADINTMDCFPNETCIANPACTNLTAGMECPAAYVCQPMRPTGASSGTGSGTGSGSSTTGGSCTPWHCTDAQAFFNNYCTSCHVHSYTCASPASDPNIALRLQNGTMPPSGSTQPSSTDVNSLLQWISCGEPQ